MSFFDSMYVTFEIVSTATHDIIIMKEGLLRSQSSLNLTLRAEQGTKIVLSNGELLTSLDIELSLQTCYKIANEMAEELTQNDIGFLIQTFSQSDGYFLHGSVLWAENQLPYHLLTNQGLRRCSLTISTIKTIFDGEQPYTWEIGREHLLHLTSMTLSHSS